MPKRKAVDDSDRITVFAEMLTRAGIDPLHAVPIAYGICTRCHCHCLTKYTDIIGTSDDIDDRIGIGLTAGALAKCMAKTKVIIPVEGEYAYVLWHPYMTRCQRRKWMLKNRESYDAALSRAWCGLAQKPTIDEDSDSFLTDLFGNVIEDPPDESQPKQAGYHRVVKRWFELWAERYGERYVFKAKDGAALKRFIKSHGANKIIFGLENFIRCNEPYFKGHDLSGFVQKINRWLGSKSGQGNLQEHGISYSGANEPPPVADLDS